MLGPVSGLWPRQVGPGLQQSGPISQSHLHVFAQAPTQINHPVLVGIMETLGRRSEFQALWESPIPF